MAENINTAIIERLEKVVESLQENSVKMGQLLAVHNEKLDKQDRVDEVLFERLARWQNSINQDGYYPKDRDTGQIVVKHNNLKGDK